MDFGLMGRGFGLYLRRLASLPKIIRHARSTLTSRIMGAYGTVPPETLKRIEKPLKIAVGLEKT